MYIGSNKDTSCVISHPYWPSASFFLRDHDVRPIMGYLSWPILWMWVTLFIFIWFEEMILISETLSPEWLIDYLQDYTGEININDETSGKIDHAFTHTKYSTSYSWWHHVFHIIGHLWENQLLTGGFLTKGCVWMFSLLVAWTSCWTYSQVAIDLRPHDPHLTSL